MKARRITGVFRFDPAFAGIRRLNDSTITVTVCLFLAAFTLLCYWPVLSHQFLSFDDNHYLFDSGYVTKGLTWSGASWALQTGYFSNWHPLTWLSYMLDAETYGMSPGGFHLTNLLFHVANSLLLFLLLKSMTKRLWPSAMVSALFAWHPLHVESVAWVSERKDVLSAFFFLLTLFSYFRYVKERKASPSLPNRVSRYYLLSLLFFVLALASKQMVVTLPCVLLLLDFWPLQRIPFETVKRRELVSSAPVLLREKLPFLALAFAASVVAFAVQKAGGSVSSVEAMPIRYRIANALLAYVAYLADTFWPVNLSAVYPLASHFSFAAVLAAAVILSAVSAFVVCRTRQNPFLAVGWFWFVGTLVPVIGLIQVGAQSRADRYTYIPSIGLFFAFIWGIDAIRRWAVARAYSQAVIPRESSANNPQAATLPSSIPHRIGARGFQLLALSSSLVILAACLVCARTQVGYWHDGEKLFRHAIAINRGNFMAYDCLGKALEDLGRKEEAIRAWSEAVRLEPNCPEARYNLGTSLLGEERLDEALPHLQAAVRLTPNNANAHQNLGNVYLKSGNLAAATSEYASAAAMAPDNAVFVQVLGAVLLRQARWSDAETVLAGALKLDPRSADANRDLGIALVNQGRRPEAIHYFSEAVRLQPNNSDMRFNLGLAFMEENQPALAAEQFGECLRLNSNETRSHFRIALAFSQMHKPKDAITHYREALHLTPEFPEALNELARLLACASDPGLRDGAEAIKLAEKACAMTHHQQATMLTTLAAAYAEVGRFEDAAATAQIARNLATRDGQSDLAAKAGELLELSQSGRPLRD